MLLQEVDMIDGHLPCSAPRIAPPNLRRRRRRRMPLLKLSLQIFGEPLFEMKSQHQAFHVFRRWILWMDLYHQVPIK